MTLDAINSNSVALGQVKGPNFKSSQSVTSIPYEIDEEKSNATKYMIGATALAALIGLGIAGRKGKLGENVQKMLGGAKKNPPATTKTKPQELNDESKKAYHDAKQKLDGSITCKVKNKKSKELNELGQYHHSQELKMNNIKKQLIKKGKLNYQLEFKNNKITVENGKIKNLINEKGESWQITDTTDKEFVKELKQAISKENDKRVVNEWSTREGLKYLEAQEKSVQQKKIQSDKNNKEWLRKQHQIKEEEYSKCWNNALEQKAI